MVQFFVSPQKWRYYVYAVNQLNPVTSTVGWMNIHVTVMYTHDVLLFILGSSINNNSNYAFDCCVVSNLEQQNAHNLKQYNAIRTRIFSWFPF